MKKESQLILERVRSCRRFQWELPGERTFDGSYKECFIGGVFATGITNIMSMSISQKIYIIFWSNPVFKYILPLTSSLVHSFSKSFLNVVCVHNIIATIPVAAPMAPMKRGGTPSTSIITDAKAMDIRATWTVLHARTRW